MTLEHLIREWNIAKFDIIHPKTEEDKHKSLKYAKSLADTAMQLYGYDLYEEQGGCS